MDIQENDFASVLNAADLLHNDSEMFFVCTASGRVIFTASNLKDYLAVDLTGRNLNDFMPDETAALIIANAHTEQSCDFRCEIMGRAINGSTEVSEGHITVLLYPLTSDGKTFIRQSSAKFLARELSNSLSLMSASLELLKGQIPHKPEIDMPMAVLNQNVMRLLRLSRNMSDYALFQNGSLTVTSVYEDIVAFCVKLWEETSVILEKSGFTLKSVFPKEPVLCHFDKEKLERILLNIISNSVRNDSKHFLRIALSCKENSVSITVSDRGKGIPQHAMQNVFDLHSSDDPVSQPLSGAGFGLALSKAYCELMGGSLVISSSDFSGTAACITLPLSEGDFNMLRSPQIDYAGGFNHILLELSTSISSDFFL